jgi:hypothetical protein
VGDGNGVAHRKTQHDPDPSGTCRSNADLDRDAVWYAVPVKAHEHPHPVADCDPHPIPNADAHHAANCHASDLGLAWRVLSQHGSGRQPSHSAR